MHWTLASPSSTARRINGRLATPQVHLRPVTVCLDLVNPVGTRGRTVALDRMARLDKTGVCPGEFGAFARAKGRGAPCFVRFGKAGFELRLI
jgi:hypothetical protein